MCKIHNNVFMNVSSICENIIILCIYCCTGHGTCLCGTCSCDEGFVGFTCNCRTSNSSCVNPDDNDDDDVRMMSSLIWSY